MSTRIASHPWTPYSAARRARYATRALATMVLVGVQPTLMHVPPTYCRSTTAVFQPAAPRAPASGFPDWPVPMIMASNLSAVIGISPPRLALVAKRPVSLPGRPRMRRYNRPMHLLRAAAFVAALIAVAAYAAAVADYDRAVEEARKRWGESPHGPLLERILPPTFEPS